MTEEQAHTNAEALSIAMGITFYVVATAAKSPNPNKADLIMVRLVSCIIGSESKRIAPLAGSFRG
jgi:hypothetical protein